ncbi:MAG: threonine synthase, partial [Verrucomicrobiota bacterium]
RSSDEEILANIKMVKEEYDYLVCPHTACGFQEIDPSKTNVVLATAHPAKFPEVMKKALGEAPTEDSLEALKKKKQVSYDVEATPEAVKKFVEENKA